MIIKSRLPSVCRISNKNWRDFNMTLKNFAKAHNKKVKDIISLLKKHIDEVNADDEHAKYYDDEWQFDDFATDFFEKLLAEDKKFSFPEPEFLKKPIENDLSEVEELQKQISDLKNSLQLAKDTADAKDEEFKKLQSRILSYEDGASFINGDLIRKYQNKSERLEKELSQAKSDLIKIRELKDSHISKQETTIRELQNKISELNSIIKKKMDSDMENLQKSISEDKLKSEIHNLELKLADSEREKEKIRISLEDSQIKNTELCNLIEISIKSLSRVQQNLKGGIEVQTVEKIPDEEETPATLIQQEKFLPETSESTKQVGFFRRMMKAAGFF